MMGVSHNEHLKFVKLSTYGIIFFGTPHRGTDSASLAKQLVNEASVSLPYTRTVIPEHLERDSCLLELQAEQYKFVSWDFFTIFCYESHPTRLLKGNSMVSFIGG
jgi:hypothetical protein